MNGGSRLDTEATPGRADVFSRIWGCETKTYNETQLNNKIESLAASVGTFSGRNTVGINIECLSPAQKEILEISKEFLIDPVFNESLIEREKVMILQQIKSRKDSPTFWNSKFFSEMMYPNHPYGRDSFANEEIIKSYSATDFKNYFSKISLNSESSICLIGDFDESVWMKFFESLPVNKQQSLPELPAPAPLKENIRFHYNLKKEQTHVMFGYRSLALNDNRRSVLEVMESILSGMGGRLFNELREKHSLAYTVAPIKFEGLNTGYFGAYIGCSPEKVEKAISMMRAEFSKLKRELVDESELARAKQFLIGSFDIDLQRKSALCNTVAFNDIYGIDYKKILDANGRYSPITANHIRDLANEIFGGFEVVVSVGTD